MHHSLEILLTVSYVPHHYRSSPRRFAPAANVGYFTSDARVQLRAASRTTGSFGLRTVPGPCARRLIRCFCHAALPQGGMDPKVMILYTAAYVRGLGAGLA